MAHGFLTPTPVSGDNFWKNLNKVRNGLQDLFNLYRKGNKILQAYVREVDPKQLTSGQTKALPPASQKAIAGSPAMKMLKGSSGAITKTSGGLVEKNPTDIDVKTGKRLPPGGPRLPGSAGGVKGGTFTNISGNGGLNAENFFTRAQSGVGASGEYLSKAQRIADFRQSQEMRSAASAAPPISPDSGADIVAAVNRNTQMIVSLVEATKQQTTTEVNLTEKQIQAQETLMSRAAARAEERGLEEGSDLSGFMTPENFARKQKQDAKKETGSKLKEIIRGPNPFKQDCCCGGGGGIGDIIGGGPAGGRPRGRRGGGGIGIPDFVRQKGSMLDSPTGKIMRRGGGRALTRGAAMIGGKAAAKGVAKGLGKMGLKKIPGVGAVAGAAFAAERAMKGDWLGAGGELLSGLAGTIPGIGTGVSAAIDAGLMARDAGLTPFARGGIVTQPTSGLVGEAGQEGVFPLEGKRGRDTFRMFGEGILEAQKRGKDEFSKIQAAGLKLYYENQGGFKMFGEIFKTLLGPLLGGAASILGAGLNTLLGGAANAATLGGGGLVDPTISGDEEEYLMRLMIAEAGGEGEVGMAAVGRSVLNRAGLIQSGEVRPGMFNAKSGSIMDVINASGQYQPVREGKLKRDLSPEERARAKKALEMARNQASLRGSLEAQGMSSADVNKIMASTGFRTKDAFYDKSQEVNVATLGAHRFNTAGNAKMLTPGAVKMNTGMQAGTGMATFGETGNVSNAAGYVHGHFQTNNGSKADLVNDVAPIVRGLLNSGVKDVSITSGEQFRANMSDAEIRGLIEKGVAKHTHSGDGRSVDIFVPKGTKVPFPLADVKNTGGRGGITGVLPGSGKVWVGHLDPSSKSGGRAHSPNEPNMAGANTPGPQAAAPAGSYNIPGAPELSNILNAANPNTGTPIMATSAQVAMASAAPSGAAPTIINNYYTGGGQSGGVNPNGVTAGISMGDTGTAVFQDLRIRSLG